jgi:aryl-alcohol dehydrogenase-like predicted oxidoreductase
MLIRLLVMTPSLPSEILQYFGVGSIPWSPLARGLLTRPLGEKSKRGEVDRCAFLLAYP